MATPRDALQRLINAVDYHANIAGSQETTVSDAHRHAEIAKTLSECINLIAERRGNTHDLDE